MRWSAVVAACVVASCLAGCSDGEPFVTRSPVAVFSVTRCPTALGTLQDVAAPARHGEQLVESDLHPSAALVCEYGSVFDQGPGPHRTLARQIGLDAAEAQRLASAAARIDVGTSAGPAGCPGDTGNVVVIAFAHGDAPPVDLWWNSTGCQTIDDGAIGAAQVADESFGDFQAVFAELTRRA